MADRVKRHGVPAFLRLGHGMVLLHAAAERTVAEPAGRALLAQPFFSAAFFFFIVS